MKRNCSEKSLVVNLQLQLCLNVCKTNGNCNGFSKGNGFLYLCLLYQEVHMSLLHHQKAKKPIQIQDNRA